MKKLSVILIAASAFLLAACSDSTGGNMSPGNEEANGESGTSRVTFAAASDDITVFAFRREADGYKYRKTFSGGWIADPMLENVYRRDAKISSGTYKFIFAKGYGWNLTPAPANLVQNTDFESVGFRLASDGTYYSGADELFLEKDPENVIPYDIPYTATVSSTLTRAVGRIDVNLNRGYYEKGVYVPVPFAEGENILGLFREIELTVSGVGTFVGLSGGQGAGTVKHSLYGSDHEEITDEGFVRFTGPYVIPAQTPFDINVRLIPVEGSGNPVLVKDFTGNHLVRNEKLTLNLWVTAPTEDSDIIIGITAETAPITDLGEGEAGIWN